MNAETASRPGDFLNGSDKLLKLSRARLRPRFDRDRGELSLYLRKRQADNALVCLKLHRDFAALAARRGFTRSAARPALTSSVGCNLSPAAGGASKSQADVGRRRVRWPPLHVEHALVLAFEARHDNGADAVLAHVGNPIGSMILPSRSRARREMAITHLPQHAGPRLRWCQRPSNCGKR
jgi:hypothetical protein